MIRRFFRFLRLCLGMNPLTKMDELQKSVDDLVDVAEYQLSEVKELILVIERRLERLENMFLEQKSCTACSCIGSNSNDLCIEETNIPDEGISYSYAYSKPGKKEPKKKSKKVSKKKKA